MAGLRIILAAATMALGCVQRVAGADPSGRPNVVFILSDDQDSIMGSMEYMPLVNKYITEQGTTFSRHYCTVSLCCPSRVSIWTGQAAHNHNITSTTSPYGTSTSTSFRSSVHFNLRQQRTNNAHICTGGYAGFIEKGLNDNYLPIWLQEAGYATYYIGKLFNSQFPTNYYKPFAKGWTGSVSRLCIKVSQDSR